MDTKAQLIIALIFLCIVDIVIPIPLLGCLLIYIVAQKPPWFRDLVNKIYI
jgi:hypothetical protein